MHEFVQRFAHEFVDEFFTNFVHEFKYEIHTNSYEFFARKIGYVTNGLYCRIFTEGNLTNEFFPQEISFGCYFKTPPPYLETSIPKDP